MAVLPEKVISVLAGFLNLFREMMQQPLIAGFSIVLLILGIIAMVFLIIGVRKP